jgi:2-methylisocitrate lyase-like PEP mutase family enzyme
MTMTTNDLPGADLRELLADGRLIAAPGVYDGLSAALVRRAGFPAAYMTGAGVAVSLGLPDLGLVTMTEMVDRARLLAGLLDVPLIADADTGYGSPINVARTVREYERAGVQGIQLEDQTFPKRCGHLAGKEVVDAERFALVLEAALEARRDPHTLIVARTDARASLGLDEAIRRGRRYAEIGADVIFVEAPESVAEIERIAAEIDAPLLLNVVDGGRTPELPPDRLAELGFRVAIHPGAVLGAVAGAAIGALGRLGDGPTEAPAPGPHGLFELVGLDEWLAVGDRFSDYDRQEAAS